MDHRDFDRLARALHASGTRRRAIRTALAGLIGIGATAAISGGTSAAPRATCRRNGASCTRASQCCDGNCPTGHAVPRAKRNRCARPDAPCAANPGVCAVNHVLGFDYSPASGVCQPEIGASCAIAPATGSVSCVTSIDGCAFQTCFTNHAVGPRTCAAEADCLPYETCLTGMDVGGGYQRFDPPTCVSVSGFQFATCDAGWCCPI
jgi:hypothetical protein